MTPQQITEALKLIDGAKELLLPRDCRGGSLAFTKLEEAQMWLEKELKEIIDEIVK